MNSPSARFDTRLSSEQKEILEYASRIGGYRSLSDFVISAAQKSADELLEKHRTILASQKDQAIFFKAVMNPPAPGKNLRKAAKRYNEKLSGK
jgi:uncharacterized protein (DUF1778 family)